MNPAAYHRNVESLDFKGGFKGIVWSTAGVSNSGARDVGWMCDFDAPANWLEGINTSSLVFHEAFSGFKWMQQDGAVLSRVSGELAYEAALYSLNELGCKQRNANFVIKDITEVS